MGFELFNMREHKGLQLLDKTLLTFGYKMKAQD